MAALSGSSDPSPQHRTALAAADVDGTFMRVAFGRYSERKREHWPRACQNAAQYLKEEGVRKEMLYLFVTHHSLYVF